MYSMLRSNVKIELEPISDNCYGNLAVIPGHSQEIADILNYFIIDINNIDDKIIKNIANALLENGYARDFIIAVWQKRYYGNEGLGKALTLSYACGRCTTTNCHGLGIIVIGPPGYGKSDGMKVMLVLMPEEYAIQGKESAQAMFYDNRPSGCIRYKDEIDFNNADDIKQQWTYFQTGVPKSVTESDGEGSNNAVEHTSPIRMTIWGSIVDFNADEQIRNRYIVIEVKSDSITLKKIHKLQNEIATGKYQTPIEVNVETKICRAITGILGPKSFDVTIPFAENIEFNNTDPRTASMFRDAIRASAIWNYPNRVIDKYGRLEATEEDFDQALDMFNLIGGASANKWNEAERNMLQALINNGRTATFNHIASILNVSKPRIFQILNGRDTKDNQKKYGLLSKCPQLSINQDKKPYILELGKKFELEPGNLNIVLKAD